MHYLNPKVCTDCVRTKSLSLSLQIGAHVKRCHALKFLQREFRRGAKLPDSP